MMTGFRAKLIGSLRYTLTNPAFLLSLLAYAAIFIVGASHFLSTQTLDNSTLERISDAAGDGVGTGFKFVAALYTSLSPVEQKLITVATGLSYILFTFIFVEKGWRAFTLFLLLVPAMILYLSIFQKETFAIPIVIGAQMLITQRRLDLKTIIMVGALYAVYAAAIRPYFAVIYAVFVALYLIRNRMITGIPLLLGCLAILMILAPSEALVSLQNHRDDVNAVRMGFSGAGARSAFMNPFRPTGAWTFVGNYVYAIFKLNLPVLFDFRPQSVVLTFNNLAYFYLAFRSLCSRDERFRAGGMLFVAHVVTLAIFEPDLGSYFRHVSTVLIYLAPALTLVGRPMEGFGSAQPRPVKGGYSVK